MGLHSWSEEAQDIFQRAAKEPLVARRSDRPVMRRSEVEAILPHRDPFLLIDRVTGLEVEEGFAVARLDLSRVSSVLAGHFPGNPVYPGVLQIESIGQTGILLGVLRQRLAQSSVVNILLTNVLSARFLYPIRSTGDLEICATVLEHGLMLTVVGQTIKDGIICGVAAVHGVIEAED